MGLPGLRTVRRFGLALALAASALLLPRAGRADTVRVTVAYYSAATGPYFDQMARAFEKANPGTTIKIEVVNWDDLLQKLQTDISGGSNPDISIVGTRWLLDFVKNGIAEPLDSYMTPAFRSRFVPVFLKPADIKGHTYGLPIAASARAMFYNKAMLTKAGFPNGPATWDDVVAAAKKIKADGGEGFGLQGKAIETDVYWYYALWSYGGDVVGPDGKAAFDSPAGVKALTLYKSMIDQGLTQPSPTNYTREDVQNLFKQGRVGMVITAPFLINQIAKEAPKLQYGIVPVPKGTTSSTYAVTDSVVMFKNSKVKKSAWKFLDFLFTKQPRVLFNKNEGFLPTTKAAAQDPYFADNARLRVFVKMLPTAHFAPTITGWEDTAKAVSDAVQSVYLGKAQPAAALKQATTQANQALGQ
ncbi:MAG TPA: sugar ABC transporter substrate-binding protein [Acetobacteraceae bacterium]|jgi:multiple sugar transport system substrate-binding protein|nr:sugar ABC transporter substrate-binding protein [Acetobacteraceae bacterium]